ncbi:uncharacterized protein [Diabrotica undecimpunctata]|uniref:uncharacterized protein isoform X1 n=1 Tax=Diabrotica undecimpunctata TaxID=50387 RepID=UPI003B63617E
MKTGGGPGSNKQLSDTEDRLLNVISKIHLGDTEIFDTFPQPSTSALKVDEVNEDLVFVEDIPLVELETIHNYATKMEESANGMFKYLWLCINKTNIYCRFFIRSNTGRGGGGGKAN